MPEDRQTWTLKDQLQAAIANSEAKEIENPGLHDGDDWWQLTAAEEEVFGIERDRFPRMIVTWHCYEGFKGVADSTTWDDMLVEEARGAYPQWCSEWVSVGEFQAFAKEFSGLSFREAHAMFHKQSFWCVRAGITQFVDD